MNLCVANYDAERRALAALPGPGCPYRVVFVEGPSDMGKSHLLEWLRSTSSTGSRFALVALDSIGEAQSAELVLGRIVDQLGRHDFPRFDEASEHAPRPISAMVHNARIRGNNNVISAYAAETEEDRGVLARKLLNAFTDDMNTVWDAPLVTVCLDGCDALSESMSAWVCGSLVPRLGAMQHVRLVVSSRLPLNAKVKKAVRPAHTVILNGVRDPCEWHRVIAAEGRIVRQEPIEVYLRGAIDFCDGSPGAMARWVATLPESEERPR